MSKRIGMTTSVPIEVIYASGKIPVDLNNVYITADVPRELTNVADRDGFPQNVCNWIKGIYGVAKTDAGLDTIVAVTQGDCSNTHALIETLSLLGKRIIPFAYPFDRDRELLELQMEKFANACGTTVKDSERMREKLMSIRQKLRQIDELTWRENLISGGENHIWLVSSSDMEGDYEGFSNKLDVFLEQVKSRTPFKEEMRLGYIGVPSVWSDLYEYLENCGARVVFNELQRQYAMIQPSSNILDQYSRYTYPYDVFGRIDDIKKEIKRRNINGIIHYVQSFCYRRIEDLIIREKLDIPILTLEGDNPALLDARVRIRIDAFIEMLSYKLL